MGWSCAMIMLAPAFLCSQDQTYKEKRIEFFSDSKRLLFHDQEGYIWGLDNLSELIRFDGYAFERFVPNNEDTNTFCGAAELFENPPFEDQDGLIWIPNRGCLLTLYDPKNRAFINIGQKLEANSTLLNETHKSIRGFSEDSDGNIWFATQEAIVKYTKSTDDFEVFGKYQPAWPFIVDKNTNGDLWISGDSPTGQTYFYLFDRETTTYTDSIALPYGWNDAPLFDFYFPLSASIVPGEIYLYIYTGITILVDIPQRKATILDDKLLNGVGVSAMYSMTDHILLGTVDGRILSLDKKSKKIKPLFQGSLEDEASVIRKITLGEQGVLWVSTDVSCYRILPDIGLKSELIPEPPIRRTLIAFKDEVYLFSSSGMLDLGAKSQFTERFNKNAQLPGSPYPFVASVDRKNNIWVGTGGIPNFLYKYDENGNLLWGFDSGQYEGGSVIFLDLKEDVDGNMWIATWRKGLAKMPPAGGARNVLPLVDSINSQLLELSVSAIEIDPNNNLWIGYAGKGLSKLDLSTQEIKHYPFERGVRCRIGGGRINDIVLDAQNNIWACTSFGLYRYEPDQDCFKGYFLDDGLPSNEIHSLIADKNGDIWVLTLVGLAKYLESTDKFTSISVTNLLAQMVTDSKGYVYMESEPGIYKFHVDSLQLTTDYPRLFLTDIEVNNRHSDSLINLNWQFSKSTSKPTQKITLKHDQNVLTIKYTALEHNHPEHVRFAYKMENFDNDWRFVGSNREAFFTNLSPGEYSFILKSSNQTGTWSDEVNFLNVVILPPWWMTWWAKALYAWTFLGALYLVFLKYTDNQRQKIQQQKKELIREQKISARLKQVDALKDQFLANTSHELRTPLLGIIGLSESILDREAHSPYEEDLNMIISSGKRLNNLVNDILDFSKIKNHELRLDLKPVDVKSAADIVLSLSKPLIQGKDLTLVNGIPGDIPLVEADENRLQQMLHNLVGNAIKFSGEGIIEITANVNHDMLEVHVKDEGPGIPLEKQEMIFRSFEQLEESDTREFGGAGLGLTVTKQLVELHGGKITVTSTPEKGSIFTFTLPISQEARNQHTLLHKSDDITSVLENGENGVQSQKEKAYISAVKIADRIDILVVDDEPINRKVLQNHLTSAGYFVTQAVDGPQALEILQKGHKYDLIVLDVMMPKMSGYEVCTRLRKRYLPSELPIVMLTAKNRTTDLVEGFKVGANDYLAKPFSKDELLSRIRTHLNLHLINRAAGKFVPYEFLKAVGRETITDVRLGDFSRLNVSVFFSDIREYTSLAEKMSPEENFKFINAYVGRMGPIIRNHKGFVNQYQGDGVMAIFPEKLDDALRASIKMQEKIQEFNLGRIEKGKDAITVGIGIHVGPLIMGIIGDADRNEPTTIADTVNVASRMEGLTKHFGASIIISSDSMKTLTDKSNFHFRYLGEVQVKGKHTVIGAYECFDGDEVHIRAAKLEQLPHFNEGLDYFYKREFGEANAIFSRILKVVPNDLVAEYFRKRAARFAYEGVPDDWEGIERLDIK